MTAHSDTLGDAPSVVSRGTPGEVFRAFLKLGLTSFGGPVAHLSYFRDELVVRRRWLDESAYADLVALCQFLPGPASSQVGYALGLLRGGPLGALARARSRAGRHRPRGDAGRGVRGRAAGAGRSDRRGQSRGPAALPERGSVPTIFLPVRVSRSAGLAVLALFFALLLGLPLLASVTGAHVVALSDAFYRSGALVFGGHVVLPLLEAAVVRPWSDSSCSRCGRRRRGSWLLCWR